MRTVIYLCYGQGPQIEETIFSLLSARRWSPREESDLRYLVYTDDPRPFADLDVGVRAISEGQLEGWLGGSDYVHRRKTMTIIDALYGYGGSIAFVDCDTYFLQKPELLFERIGPGRSCLHVREARLLESGTAVDRAMSALVKRSHFHDLHGVAYSISPDATMWNSGVIGVHGGDARLMDEVLHLIDQMWAALKRLDLEREFGHPVHHVEQFATGVVLERNRVSECADLVFHYWPQNLRAPFRKVLPGLLDATRDEPTAERAEHLWRHRPRADLGRRLKQRVRTGLRSLGVPVPGMRASA